MRWRKCTIIDLEHSLWPQLFFLMENVEQLSTTTFFSKNLREEGVVLISIFKNRMGILSIS